MKNISITDEVINSLMKESKVGPIYDSFKELYYDKCSNEKKEEIKKVIINLIKNEDVWIERGITNNQIFIYITRAIFIAAELRISEIIPQIETLFKKKHQALFSEEAFNLYYAIGRLKVDSLLPFLEKDIQTLIEKNVLQHEMLHRFKIPFTVPMAFRAMMHIDPDMAVDYAKEMLLLIQYQEDARFRFVIWAFYFKFKEKFVHELLLVISNDPFIAQGILYEIQEEGILKENEKYIRQFYQGLSEVVKQNVIRLIEKNIKEDGEFHPPESGRTYFSRTKLLQTITQDTD